MGLFSTQPDLNGNAQLLVSQTVVFPCSRNAVHSCDVLERLWPKIVGDQKRSSEDERCQSLSFPRIGELECPDCSSMDINEIDLIFAFTCCDNERL